MAFFKAQSPALGIATVLAVAGLPSLSLALASDAGAVEVVGWQVPELGGDEPDLSLGDDPVNGRQLCPALTRLNLTTKRSEELLLKRAVEEFRDEQRGALWRLELGATLYWWSGATVKADDVAHYVERVLPELAKQRGAGLWDVPSHEVKVEGTKYVLVKWRKAPPFGPFVFNDAPFYRAASGGNLKYECAGLYFPVAEGFGVTLKPAPGYRMSKPLPEVRIYKSGARPPKQGVRTFELKFANTIDGTVSERAASKSALCERSVDLPYATMILWNTRQGPTSDKAFRQLLTQLTPRGALVNEAAVSLAQVASAPVPRQHPGFNSAIRTRPFDIKAVSEGLSALGYRRKTASSPRLDPKGQPLNFTLKTQAGSSGLAEKVLTDAFSAVGIGIKFKRDGGDDVDGVLAAFDLDWPRVSFLGNLHSKVGDTSPFWSVGDAKLDKLLESYARTLTTPEPDFSLLGQIHARIAELEPMTVLFHHKACVVAGSGLKLVKGVNQNDPDWFRQLLF